MGIYTLTSKARPRLQEGQESRLYDAMEDLGGGPAAFGQIVKQCQYRKYESLLETSTIENSIEYHLRRWMKSGIVMCSNE